MQWRTLHFQTDVLPYYRTTGWVLSLDVSSAGYSPKLHRNLAWSEQQEWCLTVNDLGMQIKNFTFDSTYPTEGPIHIQVY